MWLHPTVLQQYIPLTATSFWVDYQVWGFRTLPYHVENILLHGFAAILFWRMLRRLKAPGAWLAGAILALHPMMVESTAWITERKNVLSTVLFFSSLFAYGQFTGFWEPEKPGADRGREAWRKYWLALFLFLAALLAKGTTFSLPPLLLLLCWWKRGRLRWREDILAVVPFFVLAIGLGLFNSWIEKHHLGAQGSAWAFTFAERCLIAGRALWFYAGKLLWPANLSFIYPRWIIDTHALAQWLFPVSAVAALAGLWLARKRLGRGPAVAVYFFAGSLAPLLGFMNIYFMRYSFVCDHWSYLPSLGLIALAAAVVVRAAEKIRQPAAPIIFAVLVLPVLAVLTWRESAMYSNVEQLYLTTLKRNPAATMAHINLSQYYIATGRLDDAIDHLELAVQQDPAEPIAHRKLGVALAQQGRAADAIAQFQKAIALKPDFEGAYFSLGDTYYHQGRLADATEQFQKTVETDPTFTLAYNNLGAIRTQQGHPEDAIAYYEQAVKAQPADPNAQSTLGQALLDQGRLDEALPHFAKAAELAPDAAVPCNNFARALLMKGQVDTAIKLLRQALEIQPDYRDAHFNLGEALARKGQLDEAMWHFQKVVEMDPRTGEAHRNLAIVLFRLRHPAEAIAEFEKALSLDPDNIESCNSFAFALATCPEPAYRNAARAVELALKADRLAKGKNPTVLATLAIAYADAGRASDSAQAAQRALDLAAQTNPSSVPALRQQLARYLDGAGTTAVPTNTPGPIGR